MLRRQDIAAFVEQRAQHVKTANMHRIRTRSGAIGKFKSMADDRHYGMILVNRMIQRRPHLID